MVEKLPLDLDKTADINQKIEESIYDSEYWTVSIPNLLPDTEFPLQFAWVYEDGTTSAYSAYKTFTTPGGDTLKRPKFLPTDLTVFQGKLKVNWQGVDVDGDEYGKEFGYVDVLYKLSTDTEWKSAGVFIKSSFLLIPGTPKLTYNVKLVAYTKTGVPSLDSDIQTKALIQTGPNKPTNVQRFWSGTKFVVTFTQNPSAVGNEYIKTHKITLTSSTNISFDFEFPVVPGDTQRFELGEDVSNTYFGPQTSPGFSGSVWSTDIYNGESEKTAFDFLGYTSPLTAPVITLSQLVGGYKVSYSDQLDETSKKAFNNISIEESLVSGTSGFNRVSFGPSNPVTISTGSSLVQRWVRALVYDNIGGYPKNTDGSPLYSNVATVTPKNADPSDGTPPAVPTVTAGTPTYNTIPITIGVTDSDTKDVYIRYKKSTDSLYGYDITPVSVGSNSWTIKNLAPNTQYNIGVSGGDASSNYSAYSADISATTASSAPGTPSNVTISNLSSGVGVLASWTAPATTALSISKYKVELRKDPSTTNTLIQTQYSFSTNISFSGLSASSTYQIAVSTEDVSGTLSTSVYSSIFTTNTAGGVSDGLPPLASPTPTVTPLYGALEIRWTPLTIGTRSTTANPDIVIYEVHASTANGFTPSSATKILEVSGSFAIIKTIAGTALTYGTTYYVKLIAKDLDGSAAAGSQGSEKTLQVDNGDLAADSVRANVIKAGTITATEINSDNLFVGKTFKVGTGGVIFSGTGAAHGNPDTGFYLDSTGQFSLKDRLIFSSAGTLTVNGIINADSGTLKGALSIDATTMKFGKGVKDSFNGIYIDDNNYWYSNGNFRAGGTGTGITSTGGSLSIISPVTITGTSSITGNLGVIGTIYSGGAVDSGQRTVLNSAGIYAYPAGVGAAATTSIFANAAAGGVTFATERGRLGSSSNYWLVGANTISSVAGSGSVTLESSSTNARIVTSPAAATSTSGISGSGVYGIWSGAIATSGSSTDAQIAAAPFSVTHAGTLNANSATIRGKVTATSGGFGTVDANGDVISGWRISSNTIQAYGSGASAGTINGGNITGATITGSSFNITKDITFSGVITVADPSPLVVDEDTGVTGSGSIINANTQTITMSFTDGLINSTGSLIVKAANTLELYGGSAVAASFSSSGHSIVIPGTSGLYIGNTSNAQGAAASSHPAFITIDGRMRMRVGAPLFYPNGSAGAYIRNIYIKNTSGVPSSSTGHIGDIMVTYG